MGAAEGCSDSLISEEIPELAEVSDEDPAALLARERMEAFVRLTFPGYEWGWHHRLLCSRLDDLVAGRITRLMVFMPPRHGKSELVSRRLPAFILGRDPDASLIACSYSSDLASRMNRDVQRIIDSDEYRRIFPGTRLYGKNVRTIADGAYLRNSDIFEVVGHRGVYRSAGTGGGITGMGFDVGIIDDPIKNRADAESATVQRGLWEWYTSTFYTRKAPRARILLTLTRWHVNDLAGRLLDLAANDPRADQWVVIDFPALCDRIAADDPRQTGEALWPARYPLDELERMRAGMGEYDWLALMQQRPPASMGVGVAYYAFGDENVKPVEFDPRYGLAWALDFNVDPMASVIAQKTGDGLTVLDEIVLPDSSVSEACEVFMERAEKYRRILQGDRRGTMPIAVAIYGDASGGNRSFAGRSAWQMVREFFKAHTDRFSVTYRVATSNPAIVDRVNAVNALLKSAAGTRRLVIASRCKELILDLRRVAWKRDAAGNQVAQIDKSDPKRTHVSDALGYLIEKEFGLRVIGGPRSQYLGV